MRRRFAAVLLASGDPLPALLLAKLYEIDEGSGNEIKKILIPNSRFLGLKDLVMTGYN